MCVTMPNAPSPTTAPSNRSPSFSRENVCTVPSPSTNSTARTAVARLPLPLPDPCVAVAQAPPTEICGNDAMLCSANPFASRISARSPYRIPAPTVAVRAFASTTTSRSFSVEICAICESAMPLNECRVPSARTPATLRTASCTSAIVAGWKTLSVE